MENLNDSNWILYKKAVGYSKNSTTCDKYSLGFKNTKTNEERFLIPSREQYEYFVKMGLKKYSWDEIKSKINGFTNN